MPATGLVFAEQQAIRAAPTSRGIDVHGQPSQQRSHPLPGVPTTQQPSEQPPDHADDDG